MSIDSGLDFGTKLKIAREEKDISLAHVSETLKLSIEKIEHIEASNIALLPPPAFTCGYLRLFSKIVGLNEKEIIGLYNESVNDKSDNPVLSSTSDLPTQATSNDVGMRIISYSLVLIAVVLFIIWFQKFDDKQPDSEIKESTVTNEVESIIDVDSEINEVVLVVRSEVELNDQTDVKQGDDLVASVVKEKIELTDSIVEEEIELTGSDEVTDVDKTGKIIALAKEASPIANVGSDEVVITAKDDCWIEVSDANNQLLYFSLLKKGEVAKLKGQEPFSVFLGKATVISITLNDIQYDISRHVRSNQIARFTMSMDSMLEKQVKQDVLNNSNKESIPSKVNDL